jgi:para-aminobenzoate synthetase component 1
MIKRVAGLIHIEEIPGQPSVVDVLRVFRLNEFVVLLESATIPREQDSRYTFLTADPIDVSVISNCSFGDNPFSELRAWQSRIEISSGSKLPPFCGGIAGLMSYEMGQAFEQLPQVASNEFRTPALMAGLFDWAIVWDHLESTVQLYVLCVDADDEVTSIARQQERLAWIRHRLESVTVRPGEADAAAAGDVSFASSFSKDEYLKAVQRVIDYIEAGDIYQANLSQQLTAPWPGSAVDLYERVRSQNAAPFCGLMQTSEFAVVSASPERFLKVEQGGNVETRPIKGTRRRQQSPIADLFTADELLTSEKDRAENVMIVDLLRNDLSRVCRTGSVEVTGICEIEVFETVQHLVSTVVGKLRANCDVWDMCAACFPGGSITGAPKIRAMQIIAELEQTSRGAYCGSLFYCGPTGEFDSSILIRTFTLRDGQVAFPVGGGVVADSVPQDEYDETLHKASGMLRSLRSS